MREVGDPVRRQVEEGGSQGEWSQWEERFRGRWHRRGGSLASTNWVLVLLVDTLVLLSEY